MNYYYWAAAHARDGRRSSAYWTMDADRLSIGTEGHRIIIHANNDVLQVVREFNVSALLIIPLMTTQWAVLAVPLTFHIMFCLRGHRLNRTGDRIQWKLTIIYF